MPGRHETIEFHQARLSTGNSRTPKGVKFLSRVIHFEGKRYPEAEWFSMNGWARKSGGVNRLNLKTIASFINELHHDCRARESEEEILNERERQVKAIERRSERLRERVEECARVIKNAEQERDKQRRVLEKWDSQRVHKFAINSCAPRLHKMIETENDEIERAKSDAEEYNKQVAKLMKHKSRGDLRLAGFLAINNGYETDLSRYCETQTPRICAVSFPETSRNLLLQILDFVQYITREDPQRRLPMDVHILSQEKDTEPTDLPDSWTILFQENAPNEWKNLTDLLLDEFSMSSAITAPHWLVQRWGPAALHAAKNKFDTGSGVVIFQGWEGFDESFDCRLQLAFAKCLAKVYHRSVFVVSKTNEHGQTTGEYLLPHDL